MLWASQTYPQNTTKKKVSFQSWGLDILPHLRLQDSASFTWLARWTFPSLPYQSLVVAHSLLGAISSHRAFSIEGLEYNQGVSEPPTPDFNSASSIVRIPSSTGIVKMPCG